MSSEQTDGVPKKFMTKDPFSFKPTDTVWLKIDGEWKKFGPVCIPPPDTEKAAK